MSCESLRLYITFHFILYVRLNNVDRLIVERNNEIVRQFTSKNINNNKKKVRIS
jgi:hypothetical protein